MDQLPADLQAYLDSYRELFGYVPERPATRIAFESEVAPEFVRLLERIRALAMHSDVIDAKTTQMMVFGIMLSHGLEPAHHHAVAARRLGASWEELHKVVELAFHIGGMGAAQLGCHILADMRSQEQAV